MGNEDLVNEVIELLKRNSEELVRLKEDYKAASEEFLTLQSIEELKKAKLALEAIEEKRKVLFESLALLRK